MNSIKAVFEVKSVSKSSKKSEGKQDWGECQYFEKGRGEIAAFWRVLALKFFLLQRNKLRVSLYND
jgi:hypothetical protein